MNECVTVFLGIRRADASDLQAADRRDRLIYVLSQINAARGDDTMAVDEESSEESEDEVRYHNIPAAHHC